MTEYPLLVLPKAEKSEKPRSSPGFSNLNIPSRETQERRLGRQFRRLKSTFEKQDAGPELINDPSSIAPERALVFEIAKSLEDFNAAAQKIPGLEFLGDEEFFFEASQGFSVPDLRRGREGQIRDDKPVTGRVYLSMPDVRALRELVSLWDQWASTGELDYGFGSWKTLFSHLYRIRPWGPQDRIPEETLIYWKDRIVENPGEPVKTEIELWFHSSSTRRNKAFSSFQSSVTGSGGSILHHTVIEEIGYEAALIELPITEIDRLIDGEEIHLAVCDDVMFIRPQSTFAFPVDDESTERGLAPEHWASETLPIAALFDGVPIQEHQLLSNRLIIDDPDGLEEMSVVSGRLHGTQMASLILHGDRNLDEFPLQRPLYVRPVMYAPENGYGEQPREDRLLLDVIYRAVIRMKEGDEEGDATAPSVFIVNLSMGDVNRPFSGPMSPWGRLLDYLSERYGILFLVSAGNILDSLIVSQFSSWSEFEDSDPEEREKAVLNALFENKAFRTLLSPAEALNVVTVGALHDDGMKQRIGSTLSIHPFTEPEFPNISSALGLGHRKVVKPEILLPGGKEPVSFRSTTHGLEVISRTQTTNSHGLKAAVPKTDGSLDAEGLTAGTSGATALATRAAHRIFDALIDSEGGALHADIDPDYYAVVVKSLLLHSARWGEKSDLLEELYGPHGRGKHVERKDNVARLLGYGRPIIEHALTCAENRATLVGYGEVTLDGAKLYRIPLPPSLERVTDPRSVSITLSWFSPINPKHRAYRCAKLEVGSISNMEETFGVRRASNQPSNHSSPRGTLLHLVYEGEEAVPFIDDGHLALRVWCREQAGTLDQPIRYGLAVTIEAQEGIPVYEEIRAQLGIPVTVQQSG